MFTLKVWLKRQCEMELVESMSDSPMATARPWQYQEEYFAHTSEQSPWPSSLLPSSSPAVGNL